MSEYLSVKSLAEKYDLHQDTVKKRLKEFNIKKDEDYIVIGSAIRYHAERIHSLFISTKENETAQEVLSRLTA